MENQTLQNNLQKLIELMGFQEASIHWQAENRRCSIFIDDTLCRSATFVPSLIVSLERLTRLIIKEELPIIIDINNYRKEREDLILKLAQAAARKAAATKEEVSLPPMNAYERRIIHTALSTQPDIKTESMGEGKNRYVVVKPI